MPDIAGAMAAIEQRLAANWSTTPITYPNTAPPSPWPPVNDAGSPQPWVHIEVVNSTSEGRACGVPGNQFWLYEGLVSVHVFVPQDFGIADARSYASQIGDIFRSKAFYNDTLGYQVRTLSPRVDGGDSASEDGNWFRVTATIPFEYYHRG